MAGLGRIHQRNAICAAALLLFMPACGPGARSVDRAADAADGRTDAAGDRGRDASGDGPLCAGGSTSQVVGTIGGRSFTLDPSSSSWDGFPVVQESWSMLRAASADQAVIAWGEGGPDGGVQHNAGAVVVRPGSSPSSDTFSCASEIDAEPTSGATGADASVVLSQLSALGQCPGTPVSGSVLLCTDEGADGGGGACAGGAGVSGTVEGVVVDIRGLGGSVLLAPGSPSGVGEVIGSSSNQAAILVDSRADGTLAGWLRLPNGADPSSGTIYCLENGHATNLAKDAVTFESIGRLGQCPGTPIDGQVTLCP